MTPEQQSRLEIDHQLQQCGWVVQNFRDMNISAGLGVAVREFPLKSGFADYLLYLDRKAVGAVEAKPEGTLTGVVEATVARMKKEDRLMEYVCEENNRCPGGKCGSK